ncbi:hypothetical protein [Halanaerobium hydrogeniformans]|uniref:Uncharacterized protein n=1 Tax=Halanaerobium hydrogeniformans TaxID=656519 RepID=E4RNA0_HALHG|nr:hypothetical protein [Halanaerobium hydrogeniformans]ADQ13568.1 hypothetical protein Halsa_0072 [Halanaerobium hydrogeniformans]
MCKVTEKARAFEFHLFGGDLDFPERYTLHIPKNLETLFDSLETDEEDIEIALWNSGADAVSTVKTFALYNRSNKEYLEFEIELDNFLEGFFITLKRIYRKTSEKMLNFPVITIN